MPYVSLVAPVDVTPLAETARAFGWFKPLLWAVTNAANAVPALRRRIRGEAIVEHDLVHPSYTALADDEVFNYCTVDYDADARAFFASVDAQTAAIAGNTELIPDAPHRDDLLFISSIPWRKITALTHPVPLDPPDSFPRLTWSRATPDRGRVELSVGVMAHHGLVDGVHMARFFEAVEEAAAALPAVLQAHTPLDASRE